VLAALGCVILAGSNAASPSWVLMISMLLVGFGLGFMSTPYLLAVQNAVPWHRRGVATGAVQFFRTIGGAISVAALGAVLNAHLAAGTPAGVDVNVVMHPDYRAEVPAEVLGELIAALGRGLASVYVIMAAVAVAMIAVAFAFPAGTAEAHAHRESRGPRSVS
jgi:MFS family permease